MPQTSMDDLTASSGAVRFTPVVVGITGGSGSGKTTFASRLRKRLGADAIAIAHDDYYRNETDVPHRAKGAPDFDCPEALDTSLLVEHLRALVSGWPVEAPRYDFLTHTRVEAACHIDPAPVILVEGLLLMCDPELRELLDLTVFMDAESDVRALRRVERDCRERGIGLTEAVVMYLDIVKPSHKRYVEPFKDQADLVIADALDDHALEVVVQAIEGLRGARGGAVEAEEIS